jgi:hypothetical protein
VSGEQHGTRSDAGGDGWARYPKNPRCAIADTRCRAKHLPTCKQQEKDVCTGPDTAGVRPKARDASRRARVQASRGVLV